MPRGASSKHFTTTFVIRALLVRILWTFFIIGLLTARQSAKRMYNVHAWSVPVVALRSTAFHKSWRLLPLTKRGRSLLRHSSQLRMMPEGPEVRTIVDQLQGATVGCRLVDIPFLSGRYVRHGRPTGFEAFARTMTQYYYIPPQSPESSAIPVDVDVVDTIQECNAKGKFIYFILDEGNRNNSSLLLSSSNNDDDDYQRSIWVTLGMSGQFVNEKIHLQDPRFARWVLELLLVVLPPEGEEGGPPLPPVLRNVYYHDARNFGTLRFSLSRKELQDKLASLGPDILDTSTTSANMTDDDILEIMDRQGRRRQGSMNVCQFLMDQSKISGIGNYILSECLYRARIDPFSSLQELSIEQRQRLLGQARAVALESYRAQGLTRTGGTYRGMQGDAGTFQFQLQCYGRERCPNGNPVIKLTEGPHGRSIWYTKDQLFMPLEKRMMSSNSNSNSSSSSSSSNHLTYGNVDLKSQLTDEGWKRVLGDAMASESFQKLQSFLVKENDSGATIYPPPEEVFAALNLCPLESVKVVIVGQDPYHGPGQGHGLAFSVRHGVRPPPSLLNIFREADNIRMNKDGVSIPNPLQLQKPSFHSNGNLECWARQGVLLLNTVLTVRRGEANSHKGQGWEEFTDHVIQALIDYQTTNETKGLVFLLWGNPAAKKAAAILVDDGSTRTHQHVIIRTSHPSPLGATKTASPFLGSNCFARANDALTAMGHSPIDWNVDAVT